MITGDIAVDLAFYIGCAVGLLVGGLGMFAFGFWLGKRYERESG